ncbi:MAG TPA: hypothetical protein VFW83_09720, partial [Bryobacteraceae bacterium]|nr:hypothetical protein [Bryobacteraceae bacterium]
MKSVLLTLGFFALAAYAQLPGQYPGTGYPYPGGPLPGQYPGGPYPGGPFPGPNPNPVPNNGPNGRSGRRGRGRDSGSRTSSKDAPVITTTAGMLRRATSNQLVIQADDHRIVWYKLTGQTSYEKSGKDADVKSFGLGDRVSVDSSSDDDGNLTAVAVRWVQAATADDLVAALKTSDLP